MDMVSNYGVMVIFIKEILIKAKNKAKVLIAGQMDHNMMVIGIMEKYKVLENISIMMEGFFKDNGNKIWCMVREFIDGKMGENILVIMRMIKNVDLESIIGTMVEYFKEIGKMEKEMEMVD